MSYSEREKGLSAHEDIVGKTPRTREDLAQLARARAAMDAIGRSSEAADHEDGPPTLPDPRGPGGTVDQDTRLTDAERRGVKTARQLRAALDSPVVEQAREDRQVPSQIKLPPTPPVPPQPPVSPSAQ